MLKFWSTLLVFIDSLHWCPSTHKNTENSAKHWGSFQIFSCYFGEEEKNSESLKTKLLSPQHLCCKMSTPTLYAVNMSERFFSESSWNLALAQWIISFVWFSRICWFCLLRIVLFAWRSWPADPFRSELNTLTDSVARNKAENPVTNLSYNWEMAPWWLAVSYRRYGEAECLLLRTPKRVRVFRLQNQLNCRNMQECQVIRKVSTKCRNK